MNDNACYRCGSGQYKTILRIDDSTSIVMCDSCGLARTSPYPRFDYKSQEKYSKFYLDNETLFRGFARSMIDVIKPFKSSGSFLDIGCAVGYLLDEAKAAGFARTVGVEFNDEAASVARGKGHAVFSGPLDRIEFSGERFDAILMNHVLEHVHEFNPFLQKVAQLLKPVGIVYCGAPNHDSFMRRLLGKSWYGWGMPDHVWHFDKRTFVSVMAEAGFMPLKVVQNALYYPYSKSLRKNTRATIARIAGSLGAGDQVYGVFIKS